MGSPEKCILQGSWLVRVNENQDILKSPLVVDDVLGIENSVGSGILGKVLGKGFLTQGYFQIVFTPALIGSVQMNRPGCCTLLQPDVPGGLHKLDAGRSDKEDQRSCCRRLEEVQAA